MKAKLYVIGRHKADFGNSGNYSVVGQARNVIFPPTADQCQSLIQHQVKKALHLEADALVFQNTPGQVAVALHRFSFNIKVGVIITKVGERGHGIGKEFSFVQVGCSLGEDFLAMEEAIRAVELVNPRAKIERSKENEAGFWVTVDPPMKFEFSHIEWLND